MKAHGERATRADNLSKSRRATSVPTLSDLGFTKSRASRWQLAESLPQDQWDAPEEAVDLKIEEQRRFVAWWRAEVERAGGNRKSDHSPRSRRMKCRDAERETGMPHQRVSDLGKQLAAEGLSTRKIAAIAGVSHTQIARDLGVTKVTKTVTNVTPTRALLAQSDQNDWRTPPSS